MNIQQGTQNDKVGCRHADVPPHFVIGHSLFIGSAVRFSKSKMITAEPAQTPSLSE
jgi:hypothetical protein